MTLTTPDSASREIIEQRIHSVLKRRHPGVTSIDIVYRFDPPWRDDFITPEGRQQLDSPITTALDDEDLPLTTEAVLDALKLVLDPEVGINVVDLGLVYDVSVIENAVTIEMTLTTPGCPLHASIEAAVRRTIETRHPDVQDIALNLVWDPPWDTDRITPEGRMQLGW
jgi:metal-sulfur cluster biosynthetic enzyme